LYTICSCDSGCDFVKVEESVIFVEGGGGVLTHRTLNGGGLTSPTGEKLAEIVNNLIKENRFDAKYSMDAIV